MACGKGFCRSIRPQLIEEPRSMAVALDVFLRVHRMLSDFIELLRFRGPKCCKVDYKKIPLYGALDVVTKTVVSLIYGKTNNKILQQPGLFHDVFLMERCQKTPDIPHNIFEEVENILASLINSPSDVEILDKITNILKIRDIGNNTASLKLQVLFRLLKVLLQQIRENYPHEPPTVGRTKMELNLVNNFIRECGEKKSRTTPRLRTCRFCDTIVNSVARQWGTFCCKDAEQLCDAWKEWILRQTESMLKGKLEPCTLTTCSPFEFPEKIVSEVKTGQEKGADDFDARPCAATVEPLLKDDKDHVCVCGKEYPRKTEESKTKTIYVREKGFEESEQEIYKKEEEIEDEKDKSRRSARSEREDGKRSKRAKDEDEERKRKDKKKELEDDVDKKKEKKKELEDDADKRKKKKKDEIKDDEEDAEKRKKRKKKHDGKGDEDDAKGQDRRDEKTKDRERSAKKGKGKDKYDEDTLTDKGETARKRKKKKADALDSEKEPMSYDADEEEKLSKSTRKRKGRAEKKEDASDVTKKKTKDDSKVKDSVTSDSARTSRKIPTTHRDKRSARTKLEAQSYISTGASNQIEYQLSDERFVESGWTVLPVTKPMRKIVQYETSPAKPHLDWFKRRRYEGKEYHEDGGTIFLNFRPDGSGEVYYPNGKVAIKKQQPKERKYDMYTVFTPGGRDALGIKRKPQIIAIFDTMGNGVVFDEDGKTRLSYNHVGGVYKDNPPGRPFSWTWSNEPKNPITEMIYSEAPAERIMEFFDTESTNVNNNNLVSNASYKTVSPGATPQNSARTLDLYELDPTDPDDDNYPMKMICMKINDYLCLRIVDRQNINLKFFAGRKRIRIELGTIINLRKEIDFCFVDSQKWKEIIFRCRYREKRHKLNAENSLRDIINEYEKITRYVRTRKAFMAKYKPFYKQPTKTRCQLR